MTTDRSSARPWAAAIVGATAAVALTACIPDLPPPALDPAPPSGAEIDRHPPRAEPYDMAGHDQRGTGRAIMLRVPHTPDPQEPTSITLEKARVYVRVGDSGPITVTTRDTEGAVIDSWMAPDPLGSAEDPRGEEARYGVPFSPELFLVEITDVRTGASVAVKLDEVIRNHCEAEPTDNICRDVDLRTDVGLDDYGVRTGVVGESISVPVHVTVTNDGTDWASAAGAMFVFGILDGVEVSTADPAAFPGVVLEPTQRAAYDPTYDVTCRTAGTHRVFIGAEFHDPTREAVDSDPTDNRWNTWFDVTCTDP